MDPSPTNNASCSGPCRKRFRPAAVSMDSATANVLLTPERDSGLQWFSNECRGSEHSPRHDQLPPEVWITIFRHLDEWSMLQVRSTCRRWKDIVDQNLCLRKKFHIQFERNFTVDQQIYPANLFPASSAGFAGSKIVTVDSWWPSFGSGLTRLFLSKCEIALPTLLGMLKETPNLTKLSLCDNVKYTSVEDMEANFRLEKLTCLTCGSVFEVFIGMFPRLRHLDLRFIPEADEERACRLLRSVQGTLKALESFFLPVMLQQIATMDQLRLIEVYHEGDGNTAVQLSRIKGLQDSIERLTLTAANEALCEIGRNLTKLRSIDVDVESNNEIFETTFLAKMPRLSRLVLGKDDLVPLYFERVASPNLKSLRLSTFYIFAGSWQNYLTNCPIIQEISLSACKLDDWSEVFAPQFRSLSRLDLYEITVLDHSFKRLEQTYNLMELKISNCKVPTALLVQFIQRCPRMEILSFSSVPTVNDECVLALDHLRELKKLSINSGSLTDISVDFIIEKCPHLLVNISGKQTISMAGKSRLNDFVRSR